MSKAPPIPREQRSFRGPRRDERTELHDQAHGDADANLHEQGRHGNMSQNLSPRRSVQDR